MANGEFTKSTLKDNPADPGWEPETAPDPVEENDPAKDKRSLDIGESGQFAPGGYYNQHGVAEADRLDLDEYTATRPPDDKK
jgi:hypothetical protein